MNKGWCTAHDHSRKGNIQLMGVYNHGYVIHLQPELRPQVGKGPQLPVVMANDVDTKVLVPAQFVTEDLYYIDIKKYGLIISILVIFNILWAMNPIIYTNPITSIS